MDFWDHLKLVVLDMDGVVFIGPSLRRGVNELVTRCTERGVEHHILTNTSAISGREIAAKLGKLGLQIEAGRITTASELAAGYLYSRCGGENAFTIGGGAGLALALQACGIRPLSLEGMTMGEADRLAAQIGAPAYPLITAWTSTYDYDVAARALRLERRISGFFTTGMDRTYAIESGVLPGIRWVNGSIGALLEREPVNLGKPNPYALEYVLDKLQQLPANTAVIGDSLSDIEIGNRAGCRTVLVLGGATPGEALHGLQGASIPGLVIDELTDLL